jgi:chromosome segregation ATPase
MTEEELLNRKRNLLIKQEAINITRKLRNSYSGAIGALIEEIGNCGVEIEELTKEIEKLHKENEELKGFKEAYLRLYSDLSDSQSCDDEELPLRIQALCESYSMNYKFLNPDF